MPKVDEIFSNTASTLSSSNINGKRKLIVPDAKEIYNKSAKLSLSSDVHSNGIHHSNPNNDDEDDDIEAGPSLPVPEDDDNEDDEEDQNKSEEEGGRFFGSGVPIETRQAMALVDANTTSLNGTVEDIIYDSSWAKKLANQLVKKFENNTSMRSKYPDQPEKFIESEADLDAQIREVGLLTEYNNLLEDFGKAGGIEGLIGLLSHENLDIVITILEVLGEIVSDDYDDTVDEEKQDGNKGNGQDIFIEEMIKVGVVELLEQNLERMNDDNNNKKKESEDEDEEDTKGIFHVLTVLEGISKTKEMANKTSTENIIKWLINRLKQVDVNEKGGVGQNRQYSAEILQILLQLSDNAGDKFIKLGGMDVLLELLSNYRKRDPEKSSTEEEYVMNLFDSLWCILENTSNSINAFIDGEGIELMLIMLKEGKISKVQALKMSSIAIDKGTSSICMKIVEMGGLKTIFALLKDNKLDQRSITNLSSIILGLLRYLPGESSERIRTMAKFAEKDYEKLNKLLDLRNLYAQRFAKTEEHMVSQGRSLMIEEDDEEWVMTRDGSGIIQLELLNIILAWIVAEDNGSKTIIETRLKDQGTSIIGIKNYLQELLKNAIQEESNVDYLDMITTLADVI